MTDRIQAGHLFPNLMPPGVTRAKPQNNVSIGGQSGHKSFEHVLQEVRFSQHAEERLHQRGIKLGSEQLSKIETAIEKAASKGARDSLILMNDLALIVNVKSRTVVTAMDEHSMKDNVFTKIDSAVIVS